MKTAFVAIAALAALGSASSAGAEERKVSGTVAYDAPQMGEADIGSETLASMAMAGTIKDESGATEIDGSRQVCHGAVTKTEDPAESFGTGYCVQSDASGDVWFLTWTGRPGASEWRVTGGTGKFEGASGQGTTTAVSEAPDGGSVVRYEGTMNLK